MPKTLPLNTRINLRGKLAGRRAPLINTVNTQAACDTFWRVFGYPLGFWLANPYRATAWRACREAVRREV